MFHRMTSRATDKTIRPAAAKRMPAKSIFPPVMFAVMPKALKPTMISGKAHPHAIAAVKANTTTHTGCWNMDVFVINFSKSWCKISNNSEIITIFVVRFNSICDY